MPVEPRICGFRNCLSLFTPHLPSQIYCCTKHRQAETSARYRDRNPEANATAVRKYQESVGDRNPGRIRQRT